MLVVAGGTHLTKLDLFELTDFDVSGNRNESSTLNVTMIQSVTQITSKGCIRLIMLMDADNYHIKG